MMLPSIKHLQKIYEPKPRKVNYQLPVASKILQVNKTLAFTKYTGNLLEHYGIFKGDVLTIERSNSFENLDPHSLYCVILPDRTSLICAIKIKESEIAVLHDGRGGNFRSLPVNSLYMIGFVTKIKGGAR